MILWELLRFLFDGGDEGHARFRYGLGESSC